MTAITSGSAAESRRSLGTRTVGSALTPIAVLALAFIVGYAGWLAFSRVEFLLAWNDTFSGAGVVTVVGCEPEQIFGPDRWRCEGRLSTGETGEGGGVELIVGKDAHLSWRPYVGQQVEVFYSPASVAGADGLRIVYARDAQLSELTRLFLALLPLVMILVGAAGSLLGFGVRRLRARPSRPSRKDSRWRSSPLFLDLERRGAVWLVVGVVTLVLYQLLVRYVLGSAGVA